MSSSTPVIFLIDNGSLRAEASFVLRCLAAKLSDRVGRRILPVSLLHSSKVEAIKLFGKKAQIIKPTLREYIAAGERSFLFLPLFLGPSRAITEYLPQLIEEAHRQKPGLKIEIALPLAGEVLENPDIRLAKILAANIRSTLRNHLSGSPHVAVIDHGTPEKKVNKVRNAVTDQVRDLLGSGVGSVTACSMERRDGKEYDFNEPLLENLGNLRNWEGSDLIAAMFFLLPGRHAGSGGDVAGICDRLVGQSAFRSIHMTPLLGENPLLIDILEDRLKDGLENLRSD